MIHAMIEREKNRPSVIMWSMENEAYSGKEKTELGHREPGSRRQDGQSDGIQRGRSTSNRTVIRAAWPMRSACITFTSIPQYTCWPNEAYWLDKPFQPTHLVRHRRASRSSGRRRNRSISVSSCGCRPAHLRTTPFSSATRPTVILHHLHSTGEGRSLEDADPGIPPPGGWRDVPLDRRHGPDREQSAVPRSSVRLPAHLPPIATTTIAASTAGETSHAARVESLQ